MQSCTNNLKCPSPLLVGTRLDKGPGCLHNSGILPLSVSNPGRCSLLINFTHPPTATDSQLASSAPSTLGIGGVLTSSISALLEHPGIPIQVVLQRAQSIQLELQQILLLRFHLYFMLLFLGYRLVPVVCGRARREEAEICISIFQPGEATDGGRPAPRQPETLPTHRCRPPTAEEEVEAGTGFWSWTSLRMVRHLTPR